jgi:hypothetical protein
MGAKDWMLLYADSDPVAILRSHPELDRPATRALVERLHPAATLAELPDASLQFTNPDDGEVYAGVFPGLTILCSGEVAVDRPSELDRRFLDEAAERTVYLHAMHSVVDWFALGIWELGVLRRSLSLAPDHGIIENVGEPLAFEVPYWAGERPVEPDPDWDEEPYKLPFHPLELAEDALRALFGFTYEGAVTDDDPELETILLAAYWLS